MLLAGGRRLTLALAFTWLGVLSAAAATGWFMHSKTFSDAGGFASAAEVMLSSHWRDTYADPWLQAGPLEMLVCLLGKILGLSPRGVPVALNTLGALAILAVATPALGRRWREIALAGGGALALGIVSDMWDWGHPSELFIALLWLLAAQAARRERMLLAGCLLGLSAGFETWGLLGAPVLFLLPQLRRTIFAGVLALVVAAACYLPFALGGDFHMFHLHWAVVGGVPAYLFGEGTTFSWTMRLAEAVVVVGFGSSLALVMRRARASVWVVPALTSICRLLLDPVRYGYYWDTSLMLLLIGLAPILASPRSTAVRLALALNQRARRFRPALVD
jgi:hypothetical protein